MTEYCNACRAEIEPDFVRCPVCGALVEAHERVSNGVVAPAPRAPLAPRPAVPPASERDHPAVNLPGTQTIRSAIGNVAARPGDRGVVQETSIAHLVVVSGPAAGTSFQLGDSVAIGRNRRENSIVLDDSSVSRRHAEIRCRDGRYLFVDLGSTNGSYLVTPQGVHQRIKDSATLRDGDQVEVGNVRMAFRQTRGG